MSQSPGSFSWNVVAPGCEPDDQIVAELRSRIDRLGLLLDPFPPEQVHLLVTLSKEEREAPRFETRLDLKLPPTVLHAQDKGADLFETLRHSFFVLEQEVETLRADLRGERRWKSPRALAPGTAARAAGFGEPMKKGPRTQGDVLRNFIFRHYHRLLLRATRRVAGLEAEADIPQGSIDAQEVLDEVIRICLASPERKPPGVTYELWLYRLISEELDHEYRDWISNNRGRAELPGDEAEDTEFPGEGEVTLEPGAEESPGADFLADPGNLPPDLLFEESDLIGEVLRRVQNWKRQDREIFTLHFVEGFDAREIAVVEKMDPADVEKAIKELQGRLRQILREAAQ